ncbi:class I SAM-dependent methyltransferase [Jannaschia sp. W003]|uniref:class I SAM-dependent methyltransferase n=1 Tax=Jannaschia sp. W003 TaxID=2867012 RepID=UPI0021A5A20F|nr:methyltransferase domain-containing protein [Jannaschia sp. W003]UWQ22640.1 methyltransferase domain-containing protein [Jannaschia sp. W003]
MTETATRFAGSVPEVYDRILGPVLFEGFARDLARRAGAHRSAHALELAAGTGILSRPLRDALIPTASLVVTDLNLPMLEIARHRFRPTEAVAFEVADMTALPFPDGGFDLAACQFGLMFAPDPAVALREVRRVLAAGAPFLFSVWDGWERNRVGEVAHGVAAALVPDDPPGFYRVPFRLGDRDAVRRALAAAGIEEAEPERLERRERIDPDVFGHGLVFGNPLADELRERGADPDAAAAAMADALRRAFGTPAALDLSVTLWRCRMPG